MHFDQTSHHLFVKSLDSLLELIYMHPWYSKLTPPLVKKSSIPKAILLQLSDPLFSTRCRTTTRLSSSPWTWRGWRRGCSYGAPSTTSLSRILCPTCAWSLKTVPSTMRWAAWVLSLLWEMASACVCACRQDDLSWSLNCYQLMI